MRAHVLSAVPLLLVAAGCGLGSETAGASNGPLISAASATTLAALFGDRIPVLVLVTTSDGVPAPGVPVTFTPSHYGFVDPLRIETDAQGLASTRWRISDFAERQLLKATLDDGRVAEFTVTASNGWSEILDRSPTSTYRTADDSGVPGTAPGWAATALGSAPQLVIACYGSITPPYGTVTLTVTHPRLSAARSLVSWRIDDDSPVSEEWEAVGEDSLRYPGDDWTTKRLVERIEDAKQFTVAFRDASTNAQYLATFTAAGLRLTAPHATFGCQQPDPWGY